MFYKIHDADKQMNIKHSSQVFHTLLHDDDSDDDGKRLVQQIQNHFCVLVRKKVTKLNKFHGIPSLKGLHQACLTWRDWKYILLGIV